MKLFLPECQQEVTGCVACKEGNKDMHATCALYEGFPFQQLDDDTSGFLCPSHIVCLCVCERMGAGV